MSDRAEPAADELAKGIHKAAKEIGDNAEDIGDEATKSVDKLAKQVILNANIISIDKADVILKCLNSRKHCNAKSELAHTSTMTKSLDFKRLQSSRLWQDCED